MNALPRIRLVPELAGDLRMWRTVCLTCGYITALGSLRRAELVRNVHCHRHIMGYIGNA